MKEVKCTCCINCHNGDSGLLMSPDGLVVTCDVDKHGTAVVVDYVLAVRHLMKECPHNHSVEEYWRWIKDEMS